MTWPTVPLREIAPAQASNIRFSPNDPVWHLTLDQIESHTGYIVNKKNAPASEAGTSTYVFDNSNVLYSKLRPYLNKVICPNEPGIATTELVPLRPRVNVLDRRYLTYYLRSHHFLGFANVAVAGVKMPRIIMAKFWQHKLPLPALSEQRRIVELIDQADELRKKRAEADAKAARILSALFYKMFGNPGTNPKGWDIDELEGIISETRNGLYKPAKFYGSGVGILKMFNIQVGELNLCRIDLIDVTKEEFQAYQLIPGDILINRVNTPELVGKCAVITNEVDQAVFESKNIRMRIKLDRVTPEFVTTYLNSPFGHGSLRRGVKHAIGMATINNTDLRKTSIPLPPLELQRKWSDIVKRVSSIRKAAMTTSVNMDSLFQNLLFKAFTGDLTTKWREAHMKELLAEMELQTKALEK
ncbi:MAG: restriction endonuclease subunit S [Syntrophaceae bacterium]|nr:restriction endonuclease subunit S [Syntrophaceae bacterium]